MPKKTQSNSNSQNHLPKMSEKTAEELRQIIKNFSLISVVKLEDIKEENKLRVQNIIKNIKPLLDKIDPRNTNPYPGQQQSNLNSLKYAKEDTLAYQVYLNNMPVSIGKVEGLRTTEGGKRVKGQIDVLISPSDLAQLLQYSSALTTLVPINNETEIKSDNISIFQLIPKAIQKITDKNFDASRQTNEVSTQMLDHIDKSLTNTLKRPANLKEEIYQLGDLVESIVKNPTHNIEYNNISEEIFQLVNKVKSNKYQKEMGQVAKSAALSAGKHASEAKIEFSIDGKDYQKFQELSNKLRNLNADINAGKVHEQQDKSKEPFEPIILPDKKFFPELSSDKTLSQDPQKILQSKSLYLDNAEYFINGLQNLFENLANVKEIDPRNFVETLKKLQTNAAKINTKYANEINTNLDSQYKMLLEGHIKEISENIQHILVNYYQDGKILNDQVLNLSQEINKELKNISNLMSETEAALTKQMDQLSANYRPTLETIPEDKEATFNPSSVKSVNDLWIKLENSLSQLENFKGSPLQTMSKVDKELDNIDSLSDSGVSSASESLDNASDFPDIKTSVQDSTKQKNIDQPDITGSVRNLFKSSTPKEVDVEQVIPAMKRLFADHQVPQRDIEPLVGSVRNLFKSSTPKEVDVEQVIPAMKRLFADNQIPQKNIEPLVGSVRNLFKSSTPKEVDVEQVIPAMKRLFADHQVPQRDIEPLVGSVRNLFKSSQPKEEDIFKKRAFNKKIEMFEQNAGDKPLFPPKMAEEMYKTNKYSRTKDATTAHHPQKEKGHAPLAGKNIPSKEEDIFKKRAFNKKIEMFEQNAGDKPLFPPKMAEEMYKTNKYSRTKDATTAHHPQKEKGHAPLADKNKSSTEEDIFKKRAFNKKIEMFEQNAGDKPLFPPKLAEEMYKIKNDLKAKDSIKPDSHQHTNASRFIKPNNDKGKSK